MITSRRRGDDHSLARAIGFWSLTAGIFNVTIGGSIFAIPALLYGSMGPAAPWAFVLGALLFVPIVLSFAFVGSRVTATGGPYRYVEAAFGSLPAFLVGAVFWISNVAGSAGMAAILASQLAHEVPWLADPLWRAAFLLAVYASLVGLNARGVRTGAAAVVAFALLKALPLAALALLAAPAVHVANLRIEAWPPFSAVTSSLVIVVFAYSGIETALAPSGELRDPGRTVPRAALVGVGAVIALYVSLQVATQGVLGPALAGARAPLAAVADAIVPGGGRVLLAVAVLSLFGVIQGDLLGSSRLLYALAEDGFLPAALARVAPSGRSPTTAVAVHAAAAWLLASVGRFEDLALLSGGAFCLVYVGCCAAAWRLRRTDAIEPGAAFRLPGGAAIPIVGILALLVVLSSLRRREWAAIGVALAVLALLYALRRASARLSAPGSSTRRGS